MRTISSNQWSTDLQACDAMGWLKEHHPKEYAAIAAEFPTHQLPPGETWFHALGCDPEYGDWLVDAIEDTGLVQWIDGEPFAGPFEPDLWACRSCLDDPNHHYDKR